MLTRLQRRRERLRKFARQREIEAARPATIPPGKYRVRYTVHGFDGPIERTMIARPWAPEYDAVTGAWTTMWTIEPDDKTTVPGSILETLSYERIGE